MRADDSYHLLGARYLWKQVRVLTRRLDGARADEGVVCVHQARVASRRLRAAMRLFADSFSPKLLRRWRKALRRLTRALGPARDLDVQIEFLQTLLSNVPNQSNRAVRPGVARLLLRRRQLREALQPAVVKAADRAIRSGVFTQISALAVARVLELKTRRVGTRSPFVFWRTVGQIRRQCEQLLAFGESLACAEAVEQHHKMRIAAKRLRYTMEICRPVYDGQLDEPTAAVKHLQTLLGDIHDCDVWALHLNVFADEERERTRMYYGHTRPLARLLPGAEYLRRNRARRRKTLFRQLNDAWQRLEEENFWDRLLSMLQSHLPAEAPEADEEQRGPDSGKEAPERT